MTRALAEALEQLGERGERAAVVVEEAGGAVPTSYATLARLAAGLRAPLAAAGAGPGVVVPLFAERSPASIAAALAALGLGAACSWLSEKLRPDQVRRVVEVARAPFVVVDAATLPLLVGDDGEPPPCPILVLEAGGVAVRELAARAAAAGGGSAVTAPGAAWVLFTSGSTGAPKGVLIAPDDLAARARTEIACYGLGPDDRLLGLLPLSFDVGLNQLFSVLLSGATLHLTHSWLRRDLAEVVARSGITGISAVPGVWSSAMAGLADGEPIFPSAPSLRYVTISGGSLPGASFEQLVTRLGPRVRIHRTYGQSETFRSAIFLDAGAPEHRERRGSVGRAVPGTRVLIARDREALAAPGEVGEVLHAGDGVMLGYLGDPALTAEKLGRHAATGDATVVYTGDHGHLDADGYLYLAGRSDGMIKTSGYRVYPREVEEVLARAPGVVEPVVFGVPDPLIGERVVAVVVGSDEVDAASVKAFARAHLPAYMVPRLVVRWGSLPRTTSGKPALAEIKRRFLDEADR